ncbi:pilus assembly protein [Pseudomonas japonica]|uniref:pilus assembly protein n=1 Tax=Pseudomonas japonica TaxID=256466 RepID=UPI0015E3BE1E|nr:PilC/PilY family type IV pilus protein [Pseudomonas japonica]MBA1288233.1 pilus assembly protein [Pseudomonas japonica]
MPSIKRARVGYNWRAMLSGGALALYLSAPAYAAFTPTTAPLLSSAAVTPNVMLLVDNSGSMNNLIRPVAFDQSVTRAQVYYCSNDTNCASTTTADMDDDGALFNTLKEGDCPNGYYGFSKTSRSSSKNTAADYCFKFPDPVGNEGTRIGVRYMAYLMTLVGTSSGKITKDFTDGSIPSDYRMNVAKDVSAALVTANRSLRIGLTVFNSYNSLISSSDRGPGGTVRYGIADLQATTSTTASAATTNYNNLISAINALYGTTSTPLAETYYEITRYFRGMYGYSGYHTSQPAYTSPIQYRCQRNFGVVITDGLPAYDRTFPSKSATGNNRDPDASSSSNPWPNWDNVSNDGDNLSGDGEGDTLYLDDIAKFGYDIDLRNTTSGTAKGSPSGSSTTDLAGKSWDAADFPKQNLYTYTVGFTAANQMLSDAASYGHGKYYQATDSATLTAALTQALNEISSKLGSGGGGTTASATTYNSNFYYQSLYDPTDWSGTIRAYAFSSSGSLAANTTWNTDTTMAVGSTNGTYESWNTATNLPIALAYNNFSAAQQQVIDASLASLSTRSGTGAGLKGTDLIEWTKGTNKTGLKVRTKLLGDVIDSPVVLASGSTQTASDLTGDTSYSAYLTTKASGMVNSLVVNANDGFTNVINGSTGARRFAYLPSTALNNLYFVADPNYIDGTSHRFLNDGQLAVFDTQANTTAKPWRTAVFGGTGGASKAFYALQLYDVSAKNSLKTLWEIRAPDTASASNSLNDLGYAYAKPEVARLPDGRWAAFISNGYGSNSGVAALYIVNADDGTLIKKIVVDSTETDNGLSSVKLTVNASNVVQAAYGGDLKGRMWKFDLSSTNLSSWGLAFSGKPLFTAPGGTTQPITAQPLVVANATSGYMVYFGTGKFLETADKTTTATQAFYGVWDASGAAGNFTPTNLQAQAISGTFTSNGTTYLTVSQNSVDYTSKKGWYLPLTYNNTMVGERVIYQAAYTRGRIVFTTAGVDTTDPCASQGYGRLIELEATTGKMLTYPVIDTNGDGVVNSDDTVSAGMNFANGIPTLNAIVSDSTGSSTTGTDTKIVNTSTGDKSTVSELGGSGGSRRIMWRQIQ